MKQEWIRTEDQLPPEGVLVQTKSPGGTIQPLRRRGPLWFVPDGKMCVYYTPEFWQPTAAVRTTSERQSLPGYSHPVDALVKAYEIVGVTPDPERLAEMRAYLDEEVEYEPPDEESEGVQ